MTHHIHRTSAEIEHERRRDEAWAAFGEARAKADRLTGDARVDARKVARDALGAASLAAGLACDRAQACKFCGRRGAT